MTRQYVHGVVHTLLGTGVLMSLLCTALGAAGLISGAAALAIGTVLMAEWGLSWLLWFFYA